ncbi:PASTA domain-containing protein [Candidatus Babeliales bacterium]|nr:PASTA domain-containing protein [Candidatus Babeliales bacterium]
MPNLIGKKLQASINILSKNNLSLKLLKEQEDPDLEEGILLDQIPKPNQKIKPNQHIFVIISKKPQALSIPNFIGKNKSDVISQATKIGLSPKIFWLNSNFPIDTCMAQIPSPNTPVKNDDIILYLSQGNSDMFVMPNFQYCPILKLKELCNKKNIKLDIVPKNSPQNLFEDFYIKKDLIVVEQRPIAGSILDLNKKLYIQVMVDE